MKERDNVEKYKILFHLKLGGTLSEKKVVLGPGSKKG